MVMIIKQKQLRLPISIVNAITYKRGSCMITIGKIPGKLQSFFKPVKKQVSEHVYSYFWSMILSICISNGSTIDRLVKALRDSTHRTNHGEFLWRSAWNESVVTQRIAIALLLGLYTNKDRNLFFVLDDTQTLKRAKKMEGVGKLRHHATGKYGIGHTILKVSLYYRGVAIPWASLLYIKKEHADKLEIPFCKLTEMAGEVIRKAALPEKFKVTVLFDAFYLCPNVVNACKERKWPFIGVGKSNRWFTVGSVKRKLGKYGRNVLKNSGTWCSITGLRKTGKYRLGERIGKLNKLGTVRIIFSRRNAESKHIAIVTDDMSASMRTIVAGYLKRWSIEMLIKDEKQHLGLGDYRVKRYRAVVRHLHLVDCAYACLTHVGIKAQSAQGQNKSKKVLRLETISKLKDRMRRIVWQENVQDVIKYSHEKPVIRRLEKLLAA
jgi:SRSO17 transposase